MQPYHPGNQLTPVAILLGKQWKEESEDVKARYRTQADEMKKKHAQDHPNYQYTPRKPSEKKRRAPSRQYKPTQFTLVTEPPASSTSVVSNTPTPSVSAGVQPGDASAPAAMDGMGNVVLGPNDVVDEQFNINADAFNALVQQVNTNGERYVMYQGVNNAGAAADDQDQTGADSFEFSDFITDLY